MRVLVTGATGFIGNHIINELLKRGVEVVASSTDKNKAEGKSWFNSVQYIPYKLDATHNGSLFEWFGKPAVLIHLAWQGLPNYKSLFHFEENLFQHYFFLKKLIKEGLSDVLVTGTCFEYGICTSCR